MNIPRDLIEQLRRSNVVLFCGAGISASEDGSPSDAQLVHELAQRGGLGDVGSMSLPEVAQAYELELGTHSLIAYVTERVDDPRYSPLRTHHLIAALPFKRIITTNWDTLLEEALRQARKPFVKVVRDSEVPFTDDEKVLFIKLHGSAEQKDTIVITGDDYYNVFARLPQVANLVQSFFATKTLLFLGYGLADEDFKRLYMEVVRHLGKHKRRAYAVQLNPMPLTVKYWEQKNVQVIAADATAFLEGVAAELGAQNPSPVPGATGSQPPTGASAAAAAMVTASASRERSHGTGQFNLERGLQVAKDALQGQDTEARLEFSTLESRLLDNIKSERLYGSSETIRVERAHIVGSLNRLTLVLLGISFNDLCVDLPRSPKLSRALNLENNIRESYALIREYESVVSLTLDPREVARSRNTIEEQASLIRQYLREYLTLVAQSQIEVPTDIQQIAKSFEGTQNKDAIVRIGELLYDLTDADLRLLCYDLGVDWDFLPGEEKERKIHALLDYMKRRSRMPELMRRLRQQRPDRSQIGP